jgi:hypothetical protein
MIGRRVSQLFDGVMWAGQREEISVDASGWPSGVYLLRVALPEGTRSTRVVVTR